MRVKVYRGDDLLSYEDAKLIKNYDWSKARYRNAIGIFLRRCYAPVPMVGPAGMWTVDRRVVNSMNRYFEENNHPFITVQVQDLPGYFRVKRN